MVLVIMEIICLGKDMGMANLYLIMGSIMMEGGPMGSRMDRALFSVSKGRCLRKGFGRMGSYQDQAIDLDFNYDLLLFGWVTLLAIS